MNRVFFLLFACLWLYGCAGNKKLPFEPAYSPNLALTFTSGSKGGALLTQVILQPSYDGTLDTEQVIQAKFQPNGYIAWHEEYEYERPDRRDRDKLFAGKNYLANGKGISYSYDRHGNVLESRTYGVAAANSMEVVMISVYAMAAEEKERAETRRTDRFADKKRLEMAIDSLLKTNLPKMTLPENLEVYSYNKDNNPVYSYDSVSRDTVHYSYTYYPDGFVQVQRTEGHMGALKDIQERHFTYDKKHRITGITVYQNTENVQFPSPLDEMMRLIDSGRFATEKNFGHKELREYDSKGRWKTRTVFHRSYDKIDTASQFVYTYYGDDSAEVRNNEYHEGRIVRVHREMTYKHNGRPIDIRRYLEEPGEGEQLVQQVLVFYGHADDSITAARRITSTVKRETSFEMEQPVQETGDKRPIEPDPVAVDISAPVPPEIFKFVEQMPEFPGNINEYMKANMRYPEKARADHIEGRVLVQFVVTEDGSIEEAKLIRGIQKDMDEEALRLINAMPKWKPGKQNGRPVRVYYTLPVLFKLD